MVKNPSHIKTRAQPEGLLGWMDSLADGTRLRLLRLLERNELGVVELCDVLQLPQSTVSRHLKVLADEGWTACSRRGTTNLYRMNLGELPAAARKLWVLAREQTQAWPAAGQDQLRLARLLGQRRSEAESFFAGAAGEWDRLRDEFYGQGFAHAAVAALLPRGWVVADLGCGTGAMTAVLARQVKRVIGVDQSAAMLRAARGRSGGMKNVEFRRGDLAAIPVEDGVCDAAVLSLVLTYVAEPEAVLAEAARILRPGGTLVAVDLLHHGREDFRRQMGQHWAGFEPGELEKWMAEAGLAEVRVAGLPAEAGAKGPALMLGSGVRAGG